MEKYPKVHPHVKMMDVLGVAKEVVAVEKPDQSAVLAIEYDSERGHLLFRKGNKSYVYENLPRRYNKFKQLLASRFVLDSRGAVGDGILNTMKKYTWYGQEYEGNFWVFGLRNEHGKLMSWDKVEEYAKFFGFRPMPVFFGPAPYNYEKIKDTPNAPSAIRNTSKHGRNVLIISNPPMFYTPPGKRTELFVAAHIISKKSSKVINESSTARRFAEKYMTKEMVEAAVKALQEDGDWSATESSLLAKLETAAMYHLKIVHGVVLMATAGGMKEKSGRTLVECTKEIFTHCRRRVRELYLQHGV